MPHTCGAAVIYSHLTGRWCQIFENISLEFDPVSVPGFTPQPNHWFIQPESRGQSQLSVFLSQLQMIPRRIWISRQSGFSLLDASSLTVWIPSSSGFCASSPD
ncbi:hypothetical protein AMECASPLE_026734 [Ameca splendens]|uniref:Uncharacterized protein n=1 Tax=Ameca splendens TaxID=208324 RepID=A0ABV0YTF9_9TELE